MNNRLINH